MRTIITDSASLRALDAGCVYNPLDKRLHVAGCPSVGRMTASPGSKKWHFADRLEAEAYLDEHHARWGGKRWAWGACCGSGSATARPAAARAEAAVAAPAAAPLLAPEVRRSADAVEVWADEYVKNESPAASSAGALRRLLLGELRLLRAPASTILQGTYAGYRWPGKDVENLLFNDLDQTLGAFVASGRRGIRFEDLGDAVPAAPSGARRRTYYRFAHVPPGSPFVARLGALLHEVAGARVPEGPARLSARTMLGILEASAPRPHATAWDGPYVLTVEVTGMSPGRDLKAIVDGCTAALQQAQPDASLGEAARRLAALSGRDAADLQARLITGPAALGRARRLLTLDGASQVRVTPDDDRCAGAEIRAHPGEGPSRISLRAWAVERR